MDFPAFFAQAPTITLRDPLAAFLGVSRSGEISYGYPDVVKLAGHSCPTVAGAYLMVCKGLKRLHGEHLPERGNIDVYMRDARDQGTTGVMASVATLLTGAATETGFGGIGSGRRFSRRDLLHFSWPIDGLMALRRRDNGRGVLLDLNVACVPPAPGMPALFPRAVAGQANDHELVRFGALWQQRVEQMLIDHADDTRLVLVRDWAAPT